MFFNTSTGKYCIYNDGSWSDYISAEGCKFLSLNDNKIYSVSGGNITAEFPDDKVPFFAARNQLWVCCYNGILYLANSVDNASHPVHAPAKPEILSPADGAENINQAPQIQASEYKHYYNTPMYARNIQISASDSFNSNVYEVEELSRSFIFQIPLKDDTTSYFEPDTRYYVRARYQDKEMNWGEWSEPTCFKTAAEFPEVLLATPIMLMPVDGEEAPSNNPIMSMAAPEAIIGTAEFNSADWQISTDALFKTSLYNAADTGNTTFNIPKNLDLSASGAYDFFARGRPKTTDGDYTPWSVPSHFKLNPDYDSPVFGMRRVFSKAADTPFVWNIDEDGNQVNIPYTYFNKHPLYTLIAKTLEKYQK